MDDEPPIRALVAKIVERAGYPVDVARDGAEAIEKIESGDFAVIVLDLMMPNVDGYALIDYMKTRGPRHRPAIIVISAGDTASLRRLDGSVVHSILRKPFDIDVLGDLVAAAAKSMEEGMPHADVLPFRKNDAVC